MNNIETGVVIFAYHNMGVIGLRTILSQKIKVHLVITHKNDPKERIWFDSVSSLCEKESINYIYAEDYTIEEINKHIDLFDVSVIFSFYFFLFCQFQADFKASSRLSLASQPN